jgi:glycosyltransferase involved in cell wall biosynthesis
MGPVSFVVVSDDKAEEEDIANTLKEFEVQPPVYPESSPNRGVVNKLRWLLDPQYLNVHGCSAPPADQLRISSAFSKYDLIWVLNARTPNILQVRDWPHSHLDLSDVPSTYLRSVAQSGTGRVNRWKNRLQHVLLKRRELRFNDRFTTLSVCSAEDRQYLGGSERIHVIPNGFEPPRAPTVRAPSQQPPRIGFIGLYSYEPNHDGVRWFLKESWPAIQRAIPGIRFRLAGKYTDGPLKPDLPGVDALGYLDDPSLEIATWSAMMIPIRFGGGTRIKLADAFSRKCPVVATSLGAFGYEVQDGKQLRLADTPAAFSSACIDLVRNPAEASAMAARAWDDFLNKWTWDAITPRILAAANDCLRRSGR